MAVIAVASFGGTLIVAAAHTMGIVQITPSTPDPSCSLLGFVVFCFMLFGVLFSVSSDAPMKSIPPIEEDSDELVQIEGLLEEEIEQLLCTPPQSPYRRGYSIEDDPIGFMSSGSGRSYEDNNIIYPKFGERLHEVNRA
jgi:hypothetical protein